MVGRNRVTRRVQAQMNGNIIWIVSSLKYLGTCFGQDKSWQSNRSDDLDLMKQRRPLTFKQLIDYHQLAPSVYTFEKQYYRQRCGHLIPCMNSHPYQFYYATNIKTSSDKWDYWATVTLLFLLTSSCPGHEVRRLMNCSQLWRSSASSLVALTLQRSCSTQFIHVFFGLPGRLLTATSILNTLPNASVLLLLAT